MVSEPGEVIEGYGPRRSVMEPAVWDRVGPVVRSWVSAAAYDSPWGALGAMQTVAQFVAWSLNEGVPLDPERMLTPDRTEFWIARLPGKTRSVSTYRSRLRRVGRAATTRADWPTRARSYVDHVHVLPPYEEREVAGFWRAADQQATERQRRLLTTILAFGLGAGLKSSELAGLRPVDVVRHATVEGLVAVQVAGRLVAVRAEYGPKVEECVAVTPPGCLILSHGSGVAKDPIAKALRGVDLPSHLPRLRLSRLRTTWAVTVLASGLRVSEFMVVSGATSGRTLGAISAYVPVRREHEDYLRKAAGLPILVPEISDRLPSP